MTDGNYPYFTFNSVAIGGVPGLFADKIVMGDGIMAVYDDLGFGDVAPQAILAHEYGHQVQFNKHFGLAAPAPEATRFQELNADAMAAYFLTHKRGATLNQKRVEEFLQVFFNIGDCAFTDPGHHGTPNQRLAAARLGFELADEAQKQGQIMSADDFQAKFLAAYPSIIAPDAP
jgi:predicted metalloprotease